MQKEKIVKYCWFIGIVLAFYIFLLNKLDPVYAINDDWGIYTVLSGAYLGYPDANVTFISYPLAWLLKTLYVISSATPWYGLFLHACHVLCLFCIFTRSWDYVKKVHEKIILSSFISIIFLILDFNMIVMIQFTETAIVCGSVAVFMFVTSKNSSLREFLIDNIYTIVLMVLSLCIRNNALFMLVPMAGMMWITKWSLEKYVFSKDNFVKYFTMLGVALAALALPLILNAFHYKDVEWNEYIDISYYRAQIWDYEGWIDYEENNEWFKSIGMSELDYMMTQDTISYYNGSIPISVFLEQVATISKANYYENFTISNYFDSVFETIATTTTNKNTYPLNIMACFLSVIVLIVIIVRKKRNALFAYLCWQFARCFIWFYLIYEGRMLRRIYQPLFLLDILIMLAIIMLFELVKFQIEKNKIQKCMFLLVTVTGSILVLTFGKISWDRASKELAVFHGTSSNWEGFKEYCLENPDNLYVFVGGAGTLQYYCDSPFEEDGSSYENYVFLGSGYSLSPNFKIKMEQHEIYDLRESILTSDSCFWVFEESILLEEKQVVQYYEELNESFTYKEVDRIELDLINYNVYKFEID